MTGKDGLEAAGEGEKKKEEKERMPEQGSERTAQGGGVKMEEAEEADGGDEAGESLMA